MELKYLVKIMRAGFKTILAFSILFGLIGAGIFFLPSKYYATGSLFIKRTTYPYTEDHFTYEGYYGQQAAMAYTNSVIGLLESEDVVAKSLTDLGIEVNEQNLREYSKKIKTKKIGPQIVTLITKEKTADLAEELWNKVAENTGLAMSKISAASDPFVGAVKVSDRPVIKTGYSNIYTFTLTGIAIGFVFSLFYISVISYFGDKNKKRR